MSCRPSPSSSRSAGVPTPAIKLGNNSVKSRHIAAGQVKSSDIGKSAVTAANVKNGTLSAPDFKIGDLPAGPMGPAGATGQTGATGSPAASMIMGHVPASLTSETGGHTQSFAASGVSTTAGQAMLSPNRTVVLRDLAVSVSGAPTPGRRTFYVGVVDELPPLPAISCPIVEAQIACNSGSQTAVIPPGSPLIFAIENGPAVPADTDVNFGYRATIP